MAAVPLVLTLTSYGLSAPQTVLVCGSFALHILTGMIR